jgi:hypothetical protein
LVAFAAVIDAAMRAPTAARVSWIEAVGQLEFRIPRAVLVSPITVLVVLAGLASYFFVRAFVDARLFGSLRRAALTTSVRGAHPPRPATPTFLVLALLEAGLVLAGVLFSWPIIRTIARVLHDPDGPANALWFVRIGVVLVCGLVGWMRFLVLVQCGWATWRSRFLAATLVTATLAPMRETAGYLRAFAAWGGAQFVVLLVVARWIEPVVASIGTADPVPSPLLPAVVLLSGFAASTLLDALLDATLVGMVGWRLGDIPKEMSMRRSASEEPQPSERFTNSAFEPPVEGVYRVAYEAADRETPAIISFDALRGDEKPSAGNADIVETAAGEPVTPFDARARSAIAASGVQEWVLPSLGGPLTPIVDSAPLHQEAAIAEPVPDVQATEPASAAREAMQARLDALRAPAESPSSELPEWLAELVDNDETPPESSSDAPKHES